VLVTNVKVVGQKGGGVNRGLGLGYGFLTLPGEKWKKGCKGHQSQPGPPSGPLNLTGSCF
jgi:hypothetical protein